MVSIGPSSSPTAVRRKRIGLFQPSGVSMPRRRSYTCGPSRGQISIVRVLMLRVFGCQEVFSALLDDGARDAEAGELKEGGEAYRAGADDEDA